MKIVLHLALGFALSGQAPARDAPWEHLQASPQVGPSCGFFANVPAVTLATGIDISTSKPFVRSVYGLRRGDFRFQRSFDKRIFCELFSLPYEVQKIEHPPASTDRLMPAVREFITGTFHEGLAEGRVYSLRIRGVFGGPHNGLLVARDGDRYILHNPFPGSIQSLTLDQLAKLMLVRSTTGENRDREVYVTHYLSVTLPPPVPGKALPMGKLPASLKAKLSAAQRERIAGLLGPGRVRDKPADLVALLEAYPELDFAVLPAEGSKRPPRNVIGKDLAADELEGVLNLAKFTLNTWHLKRRPLLPVVFMDGRPWVLVSYRAPDGAKADAPTLVFDDGAEVRWLTPDAALERIKADGAIYATLPVPWD